MKANSMERANAVTLTRIVQMDEEKPNTIEDAIKNLEDIGYKLIQKDNKMFHFVKECSLFKQKTYFCIDVFYTQLLSFSFYFKKRLTKTHQKYVIAMPIKEANCILNLLEILREEQGEVK